MLLSDNRAVLHMDLDTFFVSVERLRDSRLQARPLIIGGIGGRGVVSSCSYETRKFGVRSGMPMKMARKLCPAATVISGDWELYSRYSDDVTELVREEAPPFEKASVDEFYIDMSGMERFFGAYQWATELRQRIAREIGLPMSFGLAGNKTVAKVATGEIKPNGQMQIARGMEQPFLDPLSVGKIPMVGEKTAQFLSNLGVRSVRTLREIPKDFLLRIMGKSGATLWQRAHGIDDTPIEPFSERKSISTEQTFAEDTIDVIGLRATMARMTEKLAFSLRETGKLTACVTVKIRYADFNTLTKQCRIPYTANDQELGRKVCELFEQLYDRRQRLRLVGLRFSHLISGGYQINLFEDTQKQLRLYEAIDKVKFRFGADAVMTANAFGRIGRGSDQGESSTKPSIEKWATRRTNPEVRATRRELPEHVPLGKLWQPTQDGF